MGKNPLTDLPNDQRCIRHSKEWRCHLPRLPNKSYCHNHYISNLSRAKSNSTILQSLNPANASSPREIWAFYQNYDGNPNFYARVDNNLPNKSSVQVTPLVPLNPSGTDVGCGLFRVSDSEVTMEKGKVSHRAWFDMVADDLYNIFPRKGEVWAVDVYDLVEIASSFDDEQGASGLLVKVGQQVFQRKLYDGCELIRRFRKDEIGMFRYRVSGASDACSGRVGFSKVCSASNAKKVATAAKTKKVVPKPKAKAPAAKIAKKSAGDTASKKKVAAMAKKVATPAKKAAPVKKPAVKKALAVKKTPMKKAAPAKKAAVEGKSPASASIRQHPGWCCHGRK